MNEQPLILDPLLSLKLDDLQHEISSWQSNPPTLEQVKATAREVGHLWLQFGPPWQRSEDVVVYTAERFAEVGSAIRASGNSQEIRECVTFVLQRAIRCLEEKHGRTGTNDCLMRMQAE